MKKLIRILIAGILISLLYGNMLRAQTNELRADLSDLEMNSGLRSIITERQQALLSLLPDGLVVLNSMNGFNGGRHALKSAPNFIYLTGLNMDDAILVLSKDDGCIIFRSKQHIYKTIYEGEPISNEVLKQSYGLDHIQSSSDLPSYLEEKIEAGKSIYTDFRDEGTMAMLREDMELRPSAFKDLGPAISELRLIKDETEIARIQKAVDITKHAFESVCKNCRPGMYEFEMEALIEYSFLKYGAPMPAFSSIVASGENSTILHYGASTKRMEEGELLLMDIGAEYGHYAADITRTIPVNGLFSMEQEEIYSMVLEAQEAAIKEMIPGNHYFSGHQAAVDIIIDRLVEMGLVTDPEKQWQQNFYILYASSHYLGLNVHDVGNFHASSKKTEKKLRYKGRETRALEAGMVLTIEPGLYFRSKGLEQLSEMYKGKAISEEVEAFISEVAPIYEQYKGIGVRIEDDVLITDEGNRVLSEHIPKEIEEIEKMMRR